VKVSSQNESLIPNKAIEGGEEYHEAFCVTTTAARGGAEMIALDPELKRLSVCAPAVSTPQQSILLLKNDKDIDEFKMQPAVVPAGLTDTMPALIVATKLNPQVP